jgi:hypothetical protein
LSIWGTAVEKEMETQEGSQLDEVEVSEEQVYEPLGCTGHWLSLL